MKTLGKLFVYLLKSIEVFNVGNARSSLCLSSNAVGGVLTIYDEGSN